MELCLCWSAPSADRNILSTITRFILFLNEWKFLAHFLGVQTGIPVSKMLLLWRCVVCIFLCQAPFLFFLWILYCSLKLLTKLGAEHNRSEVRQNTRLVSIFTRTFQVLDEMESIIKLWFFSRDSSVNIASAFVFILIFHCLIR